MERDAVALRVLIVVGVALVTVVAGTYAVSVVSPDRASPPTIDAAEDANTSGPPPEYEPEAVVAEQVEATGEVTVDESFEAGEHGRRVVIVDGQFEQEDVRPFVQAVVTAGHEVRLEPEDLEAQLPEADAYVRIAPSDPLDPEERAAVENFTARGGHLLLLGEPNRIEVSQSAFVTSITTERMEMVELAGRYGIVFGNRYLYDLENNDGNFRNVLARATDAEAAPDLDRVALDTATRVEATNATVLLRTPETTHLSNDGAAERYPVAVRGERGNGSVVAVGDSTFLAEGRHNVAGNEAFIAYLVRFALNGENTSTPNEIVVNVTTTPNVTATPTATATATPTPDNGTATPTPDGTTPAPTPDGTPTATPTPDGAPGTTTAAGADAAAGPEDAADRSVPTG